MITGQDIKKLAERMTGIGMPKAADLSGLTRVRKPNAFHFKDDGKTPNNPLLPLIHYRSPVQLDERFDPAAIFEALFASHGWKDAWRDGIYPFLHFHTRTHEVLGIARGQATVQFGGKRGRTVQVGAGDVIILPAGTGHQRLNASKDLLVVGAYPAGGEYDEPRLQEVEHGEAIKLIKRVKLPTKDPVYGKSGALVRLWKAL